MSLTLCVLCDALCILPLTQVPNTILNGEIAEITSSSSPYYYYWEQRLLNKKKKGER